MSARVLVNGMQDGTLSALDRGLAYGDGLFETIRFVAGRAPLWHRHMQRLAEGCRRLGLAAPAPALLADETAQVVHGQPDAVVRITLTRGIGERGYAPPLDGAPTRVVTAFPMPALDADWYARGIRVRCCALRLAPQPRLAGIKHLNRLEQVLARAEWSDAGVVEGLLFDAQDNLVSATAANAFVVMDGAVATPPLDACGVAGVLRAELLAALPRLEVRAITPAELACATEVFLTSSVRGVLPVRELDGRALRVGASTRAACDIWQRLGFPEVRR